LDNQVGITPETDGEWAVDRILSHSGSKTDSVFEILWKAGDVTWLPYYQITHLQALTEYLDLLGIKDVRKLPNGTGKPPLEDPQLALGSISMNFPGALPPSISVLDSLKSSLQTALQFIIAPVKSFLSTVYYFSYTPRVSNTMPAIRHGRGRHLPNNPRNFKHPLLARTSATNFLMRDPDYPVHINIHVAQMAEYIQFDEYLRAHGDSADLSSVPIGYTVFSTAWNNGAAPNDRRRFSTVSLDDNPAFNHTIPSDNPVRLSDLQITAAQAGITTTTNTPSPTSTLQHDITEEFAALMVAKQKKQRHYFEARQEKKKGLTEYKPPPVRFNPGYSHNGPRRNHHNKQRHGNHQHHQYSSCPSASSTSYYPTTSSSVVITEDPLSALEDETPEVPEDGETPEDDELFDEAENPVDDDSASAETVRASASMEVTN
jgi:hypothetical protein